MIRASFPPLLLWISINNKQVLVQTYSFKYTKIDSNNKTPFTSHSQLYNRICWLVTSVLMWYYIITRAQYLLQFFLQWKYNNKFSNLFSNIILSWKVSHSKLWYNKSFWLQITVMKLSNKWFDRNNEKLYYEYDFWFLVEFLSWIKYKLTQNWRTRKLYKCTFLPMFFWNWWFNFFMALRNWYENRYDVIWPKQRKLYYEYDFYFY